MFGVLYGHFTHQVLVVPWNTYVVPLYILLFCPSILSGAQEVVNGTDGGTVTVQCPYTWRDRGTSCWCRARERSNGYGRFMTCVLTWCQASQNVAFQDYWESNLFLVTMSQLKASDAGLYLCVKQSYTNSYSTLKAVKIQIFPVAVPTTIKSYSTTHSKDMSGVVLVPPGDPPTTRTGTDPPQTTRTQGISPTTGQPRAVWEKLQERAPLSPPSQTKDQITPILYGIVGSLVVISTCLLCILAKIMLEKFCGATTTYHDSANSIQTRAIRSTSCTLADNHPTDFHPCPSPAYLRRATSGVHEDSSSTSSLSSDNSSVHDTFRAGTSTGQKAPATEEDYVNISQTAMVPGTNYRNVHQGVMLTPPTRLGTEDDYVNLADPQDSTDSDSGEDEEQCVRVRNGVENEGDSNSDNSVNYTTIVFK
ncbi:hypothetical protein AGOR_G00155870 [Albula goreensis]|uniref:Ig-like domain-containing protein n=1 Tax=Albula goreensis TaxID=1534307 RepID=A0A8T3CZ82_9TELE|nr:hypothetical protein AGOR_G00155870 [Albula goreensis]